MGTNSDCQHTQRPASDNIRATSNQVHKHTQREDSPGTRAMLNQLPLCEGQPPHRLPTSNSQHSQQVSLRSAPFPKVTEAIKAQLQHDTHNPHKGALAQVTKETTPLSPRRHLLHKATLPRLEDTADLPNIETAQGAQRRRHASNEKKLGKTAEK